jgi:hypothetical protein
MRPTSLETRVHNAFVGAALVVGLGLSFASTGIDHQQDIDNCCACLASSRDDFGEPCIDETATQCSMQVGDGAAIPTSPRCLRDKCASACSVFQDGVTSREDITVCCSCLAQGDDPSGVNCIDTDAEQCVQSIDNGRPLVSTRACFDDVCRGDCAIMSPTKVDAGSTDQQ